MSMNSKEISLLKSELAAMKTINGINNKHLRKARKAHTCYECKGLIPVGGKYHMYTGLHEGEWYSYKICIPCEFRRHEVAFEGEYPPFGELLSWEKEAKAKA